MTLRRTSDHPVERCRPCYARATYVSWARFPLSGTFLSLLFPPLYPEPELIGALLELSLVGRILALPTKVAPAPPARRRVRELGLALLTNRGRRDGCRCKDQDPPIMDAPDA